MKLTVAKKITLLNAVACLGLLLLAILGPWQMERVYTAANFANENTVPALVALGVIGSIGFTVCRSITRPLLAMQDAVVAIGSGNDLTIRVPITSSDGLGEMGQHLNQTLAQVADSMRLVNNAAGEILGSAEHLATATMQLRASSRAQAMTAAEMAANVEEITVSIGNVASESSCHIVRLAEQSRQVGGIVNVIREIVDQTNLLALNAVIEAARAGETGRGFAVVADEVRKLAERTATATGEIGQLIENIQRDVSIAVDSMDTSSALANKSAALAEEAGRVFVEISDSATLAADRVRDIATATREPNSAGHGIAGNVEKVARMTEENSASTESISDAAKHLRQQASTLESAVSRFRV